MTASSDNPLTYSYVGWIPTANGRLSFRHIGEARQPTPSKYANVATSTERIIVAYQRRNLSDSVFRSVTDWVCRRSGDFWFAVSARSTAAPSDIEGNVRGQIHIFKSKADWRSGPQESVRKAIDDLNAARLSLAADRNSSLDAAYDRADNALRTSADISLDFELIRDGELRVSIPTFSDSDLAFASREFAESDGHDFDKWIADQAYFFLRDIAHQHQHHDDDVDTILILQKRDDDDIAWRRNIIFSLHFYIISARRMRSIHSLIRSRGVLAYYKSFASLSKLKLKERFAEIPVFQDDALKDSLDAAIEERQYLESIECRENSRATNARLMLLAIIAPILALIGVAIQPHIGGAENDREFHTLNLISRFISQNAVEICGFLFLLLFFDQIVELTASVLRKHSPTRQLLNLGIVDEKIALIVTVVLALGSLGFAGYFGRSSLRALLDVLSVPIR